MKQIEITLASNVKEMEKLTARLERAEKSYAKKLAAAEKMGVANWSDKEHNAWLQTVPTENGWIINKADVKKNGAWFDLVRAEDDLEDIRERIANAEKRLEKAQTAADAYHEELRQITDLKQREELMKLEFEQEQKEWKKDGINLEGRYYGTTKSGKRFDIYRNNGYTDRSWHCFTLWLDGEVIFTSGEFWRAYGIVKNS